VFCGFVVKVGNGVVETCVTVTL